jgi:hypothetical protein
MARKSDKFVRKKGTLIGYARVSTIDQTLAVFAPPWFGLWPDSIEH